MRYQFPNVAFIFCAFAVFIGIGTQVTVYQLDANTRTYLQTIR